MVASNWRLVDSALNEGAVAIALAGDGTWKVALLTSSSNIGDSSETYAGLTGEHADEHGYSDGGAAVTLTLTGTRSVKLDFDTDPSWTASGGSIEARWAVIYDTVSGLLLAYSRLNTAGDATATDGLPFVVAGHATNGICIVAAVSA